MSDHLATYLNDHLSGSTAALELLEHLESTHPDLAPLLKQLRDDIEADRKELEGFMTGLGVSRSTARQAAAWIAEKFARLKMKVDDLSGSRLKRLESLEALAIGIHGKGALAAARCRAPDYDRLAARADEQRQRIKVVRLDAARAALGT
jgi:hypothetical protein